MIRVDRWAEFYPLYRVHRENRSVRCPGGAVYVYAMAQHKSNFRVGSWTILENYDFIIYNLKNYFLHYSVKGYLKSKKKQIVCIVLKVKHMFIKLLSYIISLWYKNDG